MAAGPSRTRGVQWCGLGSVRTKECFSNLLLQSVQSPHLFEFKFSDFLKTKLPHIQVPDTTEFETQIKVSYYDCTRIFMRLVGFQDSLNIQVQPQVHKLSRFLKL